MFCLNCGAQLPDNANFCFKCGKPQQPTSDPPTSTLGHWENKEFSELFYGNPKWRSDGPYEYDYLNSLAQAMRVEINATVKALLERVAPFGWEPTEPTDAGRLLLASRIDMKLVKTGFLLSEKFYNELTQVRISFRRWVTNDQSKKDAEIQAQLAKKGKTPFEVVLLTPGPNKINAIKVVMELFHLGLKESKDIVESAPTTLKRTSSQAEAEVIRDRLVKAGLDVQIR